MITYFESLTGANCTVGGQTILSLSVTEDMSADYATATAICLAPGGPWPQGSHVETVEGGVSTGLWCITEAGGRYSGRDTWRRRAGDAVYRHLPFVSYQMKRAGYQQARSTISKRYVGKDKYPPKFATRDHLEQVKEELAARKDAGEIDGFQYRSELGSYIPVGGAKDIINHIARWVDLPIVYRASLPCCAGLYEPVSKPAMTAIKEIASWSGADCYLDRRGRLVVYDFDEVFNRGGWMPKPRSITEMEHSESLCEVTQVTVVGSGYGAYEIPATPGHFRPPGGNPNIPQWVEARPAQKVKGTTLKAVEETADLPGQGVTVEQRIEINQYPINPAIAQGIARQMLTKAYLHANTQTLQGPAEGAQAFEPIAHKLFSVTRTLDWNGTAYRYMCTLTGTTASIPWGATASDYGWW